MWLSGWSVVEAILQRSVFVGGKGRNRPVRTILMRVRHPSGTAIALFCIVVLLRETEGGRYTRS